jgi:hypothetical protein
MAIIGLFTDIGISKAIEAASNQGFKIIPLSFGVSSQKTTPLTSGITTANAGQWFVGTISSREVVDPHTVKLVCTIPANSLPGGNTIREVYIYATDTSNATFMFAAGQPTTDIPYDPSGSVTLDIEISLTNTAITDKVVFTYTQATEIAEHETDPNAHPEQIAAMVKAGIFTPAGSTAFSYAGQDFDELAEFAGTAASVVYGGVTYTADHTGPGWNGKVITFDGVLTVNGAVAAYNAANPNFTISFSPSGSGGSIPSAGTATLASGAYVTGIAQWAPVYKDTDGFYKPALDDGTIKSKVAGLVDISNPAYRIVRGGSGSFIGGAMNPYTSGQPGGTDLWLSTTTAGAVTTAPTDTKIGTVLDQYTIKMAGGASGGTGGVSDGFDAVVSDAAGFHFYPTTQQAIAAVTSPARISIQKYEAVQTTIDTQSKLLEIVCNGPTTGWTRYAGSQEQQKITFSAVPGSGTWRLEWNSQTTSDLAFNATASQVQTAFNLLTGHAGVVVTGDYTGGFFITFNGNNTYPPITLNAAGIDSIQTINFSAVPDDGTFQLIFKSQTTIHIAYDDPTAQVQSDFSALSSVNSCAVSGTPGVSFAFHFQGPDGAQAEPAITVASNSLTRASSPVILTVVQTQVGDSPASNLKNGSTPVVVTVTQTMAGFPVGPDELMDVTVDGTRIVGNGTVNNFVTGFDLNGHDDVDIEQNFTFVTFPIGNAGLSPGVDYHSFKSFGLEVETVRTVGNSATPGDYNDLDSAYAAAVDGDRIVVLVDQTITAAKTWNKNLTIEFAENARLLVSGAISGAVFTLGGRLKTRRLWAVAADATRTYAKMFLFQDARGHHLDIQ